MIRWDAVGYGFLAALLVASVAWLTLGFVDGIALVGTSGVVAGAVAGWVTNPSTADDWRAGGYHGMLAGGLTGILVVAAAATVAFGGTPVVAGAAPGPGRTAATVVATPFAVPLLALEGIAGGSLAARLRYTLVNGL